VTTHTPTHTYIQGLSGPWGPIGMESVLRLYWRGSRDDRPLAIHWWTHLPTPHSQGKDVSNSLARILCAFSWRGIVPPIETMYPHMA